MTAIHLLDFKIIGNMTAIQSQRPCQSLKLWETRCLITQRRLISTLLRKTVSLQTKKMKNWRARCLRIWKMRVSKYAKGLSHHKLKIVVLSKVNISQVKELQTWEKLGDLRHKKKRITFPNFNLQIREIIPSHREF